MSDVLRHTEPSFTESVPSRQGKVPTAGYRIFRIELRKTTSTSTVSTINNATNTKIDDTIHIVMFRIYLIYVSLLSLKVFNTPTPAMANMSPSSWESGITLAISKRNVLQNLRDTKRLSWDRQLTEVFYEADFNRDGCVTFDECYERLLRFYIKLNQQAPIPPPDRHTVLQMYKNADLNHNQRLNLSEFKQLAQALIGRAYTRLLVHKLVTVLIGPYLATTLVHIVATEPVLEPLRKEASVLISEQLRLPSSLASALQSTHFWKTIFLIFTVSQLGNIVLNFVNYLLYTSNDKTTKSHKRKVSPVSV